MIEADRSEASLEGVRQYELKTDLLRNEAQLNCVALRSQLDCK
jgi:hypothetical protein